MDEEKGDGQDESRGPAVDDLVCAPEPGGGVWCCERDEGEGFEPEDEAGVQADGKEKGAGAFEDEGEENAD